MIFWSDLFKSAEKQTLLQPHNAFTFDGRGLILEVCIWINIEFYDINHPK
jgi:hypothetical protein